MKIYLFVFVVMLSCAHATPKRITSLVVLRTSSTEIVLSCKVPQTQLSITKGIKQIEDVEQIELRMNTSPITSKNYEQCKVVQVLSNPGEPLDKVTFTVTDLEPDTKYYFACRALDTKWNEMSNVVSGITIGAFKTIRVKWTYKDDVERITPQTVVILHGPTPAMTEKPIAVTGDKLQADITGLKCGVIYYWQVVTVYDEEMVESPLRSDST